MSSIFISHSSKDNAIAKEIAEHLGQQGHRSIFLDFDPMDGIPAGCDWEKELYSQLKSCRALIVLCSPSSMSSPWCFAEITHAKALGKPLFPIKISDCTAVGILSQTQFINLLDPDAYARLWQGLRAAGLDPNDAFDWDSTRPPFPGLMSFESEDAAIFFGRDPEIGSALAELNRLRTFGGVRLLLVLGASGSGKSSLVKAGLLPRLKRDTHSWIVVDPFRPRKDPFAEFSVALANCFQRYDSPKESKLLYEQLMQSAQAGANSMQIFDEITTELRHLADRKQATLLIIIDQVEELLTHKDAQTQELAAQFLALMSQVITLNESIIVVGTLRSDYLGTFQKYPALKDLSFANLTLNQMGRGQIAQVIQGPAEVVNLEIEPSLVMELLDDTKTDNALPLLAFALRELWEQCGKDDMKLTLKEYRRQIGGLEGAVRQAATAVLEGYISRQPDQRADIEGKLREAFLKMVRVNEEGRYTRRIARRSEMPPTIDDLLSRFIEARLLVPDQDAGFIEVRHEVLLTAWPLLEGWLKEDQEFLLWQRSLENKIQEWEAGERQDENTYLRGTNLAVAEGWLTKRADLLSDIEREYIKLSQNARDTEQRKQREAQERELQQERKAKKAAQITTLIGSLSTLLVLGIFLFFHRKALLENVQTTLSESQAQSSSGRDLDAIIGLLKATQTIQHPLLKIWHGESQENQVRQAFLSVFNAAREVNQLRDDDNDTDRVESVAVSSDGKYIATAGFDGRANLWNIDGKLLSTCSDGHPEDSSVRSIGFSSNHQYFVAGQADGTVILCGVQGAQKPIVVKQKAHNDSILSINFLKKPPIKLSKTKLVDVNGKMECSSINPAEKELIATTSIDGHVRFWKLFNQDLLQVCDLDLSHSKNLKAVYDLDFSPDNRYLVTAGKVLTIWNLEGGKPKIIPINQDENAGVSYSTSVKFSPDGTLLAASLAGEKKIIELWDFKSLQKPTIEFSGSKDVINSIEFNPDQQNQQMLAVGDDGVTRLWNLKGYLEETLGTKQEVLYSSTFIPNSNLVVTSGDRGIPRIWNAMGNTLLSVDKAIGGIKSMSFNPVNKTLITAQCEGYGIKCQGSLRVWDSHGKLLSEKLQVDSQHIWNVSQSRSGQFVATAGHEGIKIWSLQTEGATPKLSDHPIALKTLKALSVDFNPKNDQQVLYSEKGGKVYLWNWKQNDVKSLFDNKNLIDKGEILSVKFSADGQRVVAVGGGRRGRKSFGLVEIFDLMNHKILLQAETKGYISASVFSADNSLLATAGNDKKVRLWDLNQKKEVHNFEGGDGPIASILFNQNNHEIITVGKDQFVRIWDWDGKKTTQGITQLKGNQDTLHDMDFIAANDGGSNVLATAGDDGTVKVWHFGTLNQLVQQGCKWVWNYLDNRHSNLPDEEHEVYQYCQTFINR